MLSRVVTQKLIVAILNLALVSILCDILSFDLKIDLTCTDFNGVSLLTVLSNACLKPKA